MRALTKVILFTAFILCYLPNSTLAQSPDTLWTKIFGGIEKEEVYHVEQTSDGGFIFAVNTWSFEIGGASNIWLIKTNANGDTLWTKNFGGEFSDWAFDVKQTQDGGYIIAGHTSIVGGGGAWVIKTDPFGDVLWDKILGNHFNATANSIQLTNDGGYMITGFDDFGGAGNWDQDLILIKINSIGDTLWTKHYGGLFDDEGRSVKQTTEGGYIIAGRTQVTDSTLNESWLIKTDEFGDTLWTKIFYGESNEEAYDVLQTEDLGYIVVGFTVSYATGVGADLWLIKTDEFGDTLWTKLLGGEQTDVGHSIQATNDGGFIMTGRSASFTPGVGDVWIVKTDGLGNIVWDKVLGSPGWDAGRYIQRTNDNGYIIAAELQTGSTNAETDAWLIKLDSDTTTPVSLNISSPNGGEEWTVATIQQISWSSLFVNEINIDYTTDNGVTWENIISQTPSIGNYDWIVPETPSTQCLVKISDYSDPVIFDVSDSVFSIVPQPIPFVTVIYPNGGELFEPNDTVHIQWQHSDINVINLEFSDDNGASWSDIIMGFPADSNLYIWIIELGISSSQCLIKICDFENPQVCDESDSVFTVTPPASITVLIPNGGEVWPWGSSQDITWSSINVIDVKIELSLNNGASWTTITDSTASTGLYSWLVNPPQPSTQSLIRISDVSDENIVDQSDDVFTIDIAPSAAEEFSGIPDSYKLLQNYPNPFNPSTTIYYGLPKESSVRITIYDVLGNGLKIYSEDKQEAGYHRVEFDATELPSGVYFYRLQAGDFVETKKMIFLK